MGEIVNYDPEMAQWEGDGELVGVRTKFMLTLADNVKSSDNYTPSYVTPVSETKFIFLENKRN